MLLLGADNVFTHKIPISSIVIKQNIRTHILEQLLHIYTVYCIRSSKFDSHSGLYVRLEAEG
jgi:hypothetical protein